MAVMLASAATGALTFAVGFYLGRRAGVQAGSKQGFVAALKRAVEVQRPAELLQRVFLPTGQDLPS